ncbi:hypothetical protein VTN49DRAFT_3801 [Thermomyces lanuginosus]|uniref:uncharacterized protein n=1 Tax=Thermomyces lanuginosus TaxID=5541 RepID=UPI0037447F66
MADATLQKERHIKYFLRCLKTLLPHHYTSGDSNRVLLAFFTVAGLDLLGVLQSNTTAEERQGYIDWLYHCQHPSGGFRGFTGTIFGDNSVRNSENEAWDPATVPATFLALETLLILGDDLSRVDRTACLQWLPRLQREDGSFGELLGVDGKIEGGRDLRFCYCAAGIRYILRGKQSDLPRDIDVDKLVSYIVSCQTYDGGLAESPFCESHAGLTYCAIGALSFLRRTSDIPVTVNVLAPKTHEFEALLRWLLSRQTTELDVEESDEDSQAGDRKTAPTTSPETAVETEPVPVRIQNLPPITPSEERWAGFNGRLNKIADTCYSFWVIGTLDILGQASLIDAASHRRYLLEKTQHLMGGFGKCVGDPPDLYHAYLGLVSLAILNEPGLATVDATLCASRRLLENIKSLNWWRQ